jgi:hypothetical protein
MINKAIKITKSNNYKYIWMIFYRKIQISKIDSRRVGRFFVKIYKE